MPNSLVQPARTSSARGVPLSLTQQAALLPERLRQVPAVNLFLALEISGDLDVAAMERAAVVVLTDHEILRTVYPADRRIPYQQVVPVPDRVLEVSELEPAQLDARLRTDADARFDVVRDLPVRLRLYRLPAQHVLSVTVHPVAADDRALELLVRALFAGGTGAERVESAQYREFVPAQLKDLVATAATDADLAYWTERLADLPLRPTPVSDRSSGDAQRELRLTADTVAALLDADPDADHAAVFAALVSAILADAGLGDDIPVGLVYPARTEPAEHTIGNFANHLVLRIAAPGGRSARQMISAAAETAAQAHEHRNARIERLTHLLGGTGSSAGNSLFPVLVRVYPDASDEQAPSGCTVRELARRTARPAGVDLVFDVAVSAEGARVRIDFPAVVAGLREIDEFVARFGAQCHAWAADLDAVLPATSGGFALFAAPSTDDMFGLPGRGGAPITATEQLLTDAIRQILEFDEDDEIGREDTFFSLGGDSIAALRLVTLLGERGHAVEVQTVFGFPVLHELAAELDRAAGAAAPVQPAAAAEVAPMSASGLDAATLSALGRKFGAK
ncbi:condensation domain-containing protein [Nocardia sp. 2YAB30]|uniref:condensation domain-containing protein n=1 Tax=unclassified Nocardia TaxID=2637762 RepID=UPI003F9C2ADE